MNPLRLILPLALATTACSSAGTTFGGDPGDDRPALVLRVAYEGGFVPFEYTMRSLPLLSIYDDGRIIIEGAQIEIFPPPAIPGLFERTITPAGLAAIREAAEEAGLTGPDTRYDYPLVADASDSVFTYVEEDGTRHEIRAYALGMDDGGSGDVVSQEDRAARAKLADLQNELGDLESWLGDEVGDETEFTPAAFRVFATTYTGTGDPSTDQQAEKAWPLATPLATFGAAHGESEYRCGMVTGDDLESLVSAAAGTNTLTPWTSEGDRFSLVLRPALPDETSCP